MKKKFWLFIVLTVLLAGCSGGTISTIDDILRLAQKILPGSLDETYNLVKVSCFVVQIVAATGEYPTTENTVEFIQGQEALSIPSLSNQELATSAIDFSGDLIESSTVENIKEMQRNAKAVSEICGKLP